ncbi:MAG: hypothetical protein IKE29_19425 [Paenibacillus sp.]|uniref:hypothetical protein n=1 Tax=Paenibacillus sp. TaxID=58172 RepID=UPI0025EB5270|nr:hypothetical protein [Paenibacillus sp.]MBR2566767.1 hypothetical protein [Paenibacillus sp.]
MQSDTSDLLMWLNNVPSGSYAVGAESGTLTFVGCAPAVSAERRKKRSNALRMRLE